MFCPFRSIPKLQGFPSPVQRRQILHRQARTKPPQCGKQENPTKDKQACSQIRNVACHRGPKNIYIFAILSSFSLDPCSSLLPFLLTSPCLYPLLHALHKCTKNILLWVPPLTYSFQHSRPVNPGW